MRDDYMVLAEERNMRTWKKTKQEWRYKDANEEIMVQKEVSEVRMGPIGSVWGL